MRATANHAVVTTLLHSERTRLTNGIFMSFFLPVPRTATRPALAMHIAVYRNKREIIGALIPVHYLPTPGDSPPWTPDLVVPHSVAVYVERKLARLGISRLCGLISNRDVPEGQYLPVPTTHSNAKARLS